VGGYSGNTKSAQESIIVPLDVIENFLGKLSQTTFQEGKYMPRIEHTDDYPSLTIAVVLPYLGVTFHSTSQGANHMPWAAEIAGNTYIINSPEPSEALAIIRPYLKYDELEKLKDLVIQSK
jgi:hypothetical protein